MPWFAWIAIAGIVSYAASEIVSAVLKAKAKTEELGGAAELRKIVEDNSAINRELLEKLSSLDARLASVEKTFTDIP